MNIVFSAHAQLKIKQRKLSAQSIRATVKKPDQTERTYDGREAYYKKFRKRSLKVVIVRKPNTLIVVTAHWVD